MDLFDLNPELLKYIENHTSEEDEILAELRRYTFLKVVHPRMISGPVQGKFLEMISKLIKPEKILEIGTYTGYSAICLARGLGDKGKLITIERNDELNEIYNRFFDKSGLSDKIKSITGDALQEIPGLEDEFDMIFIDADKEEYPDYYQLILPKMRSGGLMIVDNVLWDGKVIKEEFREDKATQSIMKFNNLVNNDKQVENILLPLRDGLMLIRKL